MSRTLPEILADYRKTREDFLKEQEMRAGLMKTAKYIEIEEQIRMLQEGLAKSLEGVPDSREEYEMDTKELKDFMEANGLTEAGEFKAKTRAKRSVDTNAVLHAVGGDIDTLMILCSVKQKDLETFIKDNPTYKKDLRSCIVDEGFTITEILPA